MSNIKKWILITITIIFIIVIIVHYSSQKNNKIVAQTANKTNTVHQTRNTRTIISPDTGSISGGDSVMITGADLSDTTDVTFGGISGKITENTPTSITVITPATTNEATVSVDITNANGNTIPVGTYHYVFLPPVINNVFPNSGSTVGGDTITITGNNLSNASRVTFDDESSDIITNTATAITIKTPPHETSGAVDIVVTTPGGNATASNAYRYLSLPPVIKHISPASGSIAGGDSVTITGKYLLYPLSVMFGGENAVTTENTAQSITVTAPSRMKPGKVDVVVTTADGTATDANAYTYFIPAPIISRISRASGSTVGGDTLTIFGKHLSDATAVIFGNQNASIVANTRHAITVTTPSHSAGNVNVIVKTKGGTDTSTQLYTYITPKPSVNNKNTYHSPLPPVITSITPTWGATTGGESIIIYGSHLSTTTNVFFGGLSAYFYVVNASEIIATAPGNSAGTVNIEIITSGGSAYSPQPYTYVTQYYNTIKRKQ